MTVLGLRNVSKTRGAGAGAVPALRDVSLEVAAGDFVLLEGPSGVGKTTLLAVAAGLLRVDAGEILLGGVPLSDLSSTELLRHRARNVGFVFQRSNLLDGLTVGDNIELMASLAGIAPAEAARESRRLLQELGLDGLAGRRPSTLSGGQEQRVAVARALVHRPAVILADEPTGNLDTESGRAVAECLAALASGSGTAVVVATHDPRLKRFATRHLRMLDGQLLESPAAPR